MILNGRWGQGWTPMRGQPPRRITRDGASRPWFPFVEGAFADSAYAAERVANATRIIIEIVRKQAGQIGFAVHPRRWVVERFFAWLGRNRRLAKDFEGTIEVDPGLETRGIVGSRPFRW